VVFLVWCLEKKGLDGLSLASHFKLEGGPVKPSACLWGARGAKPASRARLTPAGANDAEKSFTGQVPRGTRVRVRVRARVERGGVRFTTVMLADLALHDAQGVHRWRM
jgi:hypothetical protein